MQQAGQPEQDPGLRNGKKSREPAAQRPTSAKQLLRPKNKRRMPANLRPRLQTQACPDAYVPSPLQRSVSQGGIPRDQKQHNEKPSGTSEGHPMAASGGHRPWAAPFGVSVRLPPWPSSASRETGANPPTSGEFLQVSGTLSEG